MKIERWETDFIEKSIIIENVTQKENDKLNILIETQEKEKYIISIIPEFYEVGYEQHYFELWKLLDFSATTLLIRKSKWIKRFPILNENEFTHFVISGIDKVVHIIAKTEPKIMKL